jgi:ribosomal protein S18 acetylase RimI-like enzyme
MLAVHPAHRRRGVARALMAACEEEARRRGRRLLTLHTTQRMRAAQRMYEALGFERGPDRVFEDGFVLLSYSKPL